jgi:uncharacterized protein (TIGR00297 family)
VIALLGPAEGARLLGQAALGLGIAAAVALAAGRAGSLSRSGVMAAVLVGGGAMMAGWSWGAFLVLWFVTASLATRLGRQRKAAATGGMVAKGGTRDAAQVLANGGVFLMAALAQLLLPDSAAPALAGAAALVAAGADTMATEVGTYRRGAPWSLRTGTRVPPGSSGAVSLAGSAAMLLWAVLLAAAAAVLGLIPRPAIGLVATAGVIGALVDTLVGAWWQARRWCDTCIVETEQSVHRCGTPTRHHAGVRWLGNDAVNLLCTLAGAAAALAFS